MIFGLIQLASGERVGLYAAIKPGHAIFLGALFKQINGRSWKANAVVFEPRTRLRPDQDKKFVEMVSTRLTRHQESI